MHEKSVKREGDELIVEYLNGEVKRFNLHWLAQCWTGMTNDKFYDRFGFDWPFKFGNPTLLVREKEAPEESCARPSPSPKVSTQAACSCGAALTQCPRCGARQVYCSSCFKTVPHGCPS
jgi:hypothetical protein